MYSSTFFLSSHIPGSSSPALSMLLPPSLLPSLPVCEAALSGPVEQKMPLCVSGLRGDGRGPISILKRNYEPSHSSCCCRLFQGCRASSLASSSSSAGRTRSFSLLPTPAPPCSSTATQRQNPSHGHGTPGSIITITHHKSPLTTSQRSCSHNPAHLHQVKEVGPGSVDRVWLANQQS